MLMNTQRRKFNLKNLMMRLTVMYYKQTVRHQTPDYSLQKTTVYDMVTLVIRRYAG